jgi:hypothetical protein
MEHISQAHEVLKYNNCSVCISTTSQHLLPDEM